MDNTFGPPIETKLIYILSITIEKQYMALGQIGIQSKRLRNVQSQLKNKIKE